MTFLVELSLLLMVFSLLIFYYLLLFFLFFFNTCLDANLVEGQKHIKGLWNIPPQQLAEQITYLDRELFLSINPWEFHRPG